MLRSKRDIRHYYLDISIKIKRFLLSKESKELLVFLFFFIVSAAFWLIQTLNKDYETEISIPVKLNKVPENVVITSDPPTEIRVRMKDKGTVLLNYLLGRSFLPVTLVFEDSKLGNNRVKKSISEYEKIVASQFLNSTTILSMKPDTLDYIYTTGKSKKVPVRLKADIATSRQYYVSDTIFTPDSVLVYAPEEILKNIRVAPTQLVVATEASDTLNFRPKLATIKGAKFVPDQVAVSIPVDLYTEKTVEVPVHGVNFPAHKGLRTFPSKVSVTFQVGLGRYRQITADDFIIFVSYEELQKLGSEKYTVKLKYIPEGASYIRISPEQLDFLIENVASDE